MVIEIINLSGTDRKKATPTKSFTNYIVKFLTFSSSIARILIQIWLFRQPIGQPCFTDCKHESMKTTAYPAFPNNHWQFCLKRGFVVVLQSSLTIIESEERGKRDRGQKVCMHMYVCVCVCVYVCVSSQKVPDVCHWTRYLMFVIAQDTRCLSLHKVPNACHCTRYPMFVIAQGTWYLSLHKVPDVCHCTRYLMFVIAQGTRCLSLHKVPDICHPKWGILCIIHNSTYVINILILFEQMEKIFDCSN